MEYERTVLLACIGPRLASLDYWKSIALRKWRAKCTMLNKKKNRSRRRLSSRRCRKRRRRPPARKRGQVRGRKWKIVANEKGNYRRNGIKGKSDGPRFRSFLNEAFELNDLQSVPNDNYLYFRIVLLKYLLQLEYNYFTIFVAIAVVKNILRQFLRENITFRCNFKWENSIL